jgi:PEP-CTERM motif
MRKLTLMTLIAGVLATASIPASAATIVEEFGFTIGSGTNQDYLSTTFAGFDPALGTLTSVTLSVTGSLTWSVGGGSRPPGPKTLQFILETPVLAVQMVSSSPGATKDVDVDLNGAGAFIGSEPQQALLGVSDDSNGGSFRTRDGDPLFGVATYTFTPAGAPVPEPSTWAMMLVGFAGLGYAAVRRKAEVLAPRA